MQTTDRQKRNKNRWRAKQQDAATERCKLTPPMIARRWGTSAEKVQAFIRTGLLPAMNIASPGCQRPRYLVDVSDLEAFEASRAVQPPPPKPRRRRKRTGNVTEFY